MIISDRPPRLTGCCLLGKRCCRTVKIPGTVLSAYTLSLDLGDVVNIFCGCELQKKQRREYSTESGIKSTWINVLETGSLLLQS